MQQTIKLPEEEERKLKQAMKLHEDSEVLLRIFKLFNLFFEKFSAGSDSEEDGTNKDQVVQYVKQVY